VRGLSDFLLKWLFFKMVKQNIDDVVKKLRNWYLKTARLYNEKKHSQPYATASKAIDDHLSGVPGENKLVNDPEIVSSLNILKQNARRLKTTYEAAFKRELEILINKVRTYKTQYFFAPGYDENNNSFVFDIDITNKKEFNIWDKTISPHVKRFDESYTIDNKTKDHVKVKSINIDSIMQVAEMYLKEHMKSRKT